MKKLSYLLILMLTITTFCYNGYTELVVTDGLVSYWTFDWQDVAGDKVIDVWGENNGMIIGNPKAVNGQVGEALEFDGTDGYVNLTTLGDFGSQIGASTFEAWIKTSFKKDWMTLFKIIDGRCKMPSWGMDLNAETHPLDNVIFSEDMVLCYFGHKEGDNVCISSTSGSSFPIFDGQWHHIVYTNAPYVDAAKREWRTQIIYIDGERHRFGKSNVSKHENFNTFTEPVYLGAGNNLGKAEGFFSGTIDEVRIYNRPLTHAEVIQNFEIGLSVEPAQKLPTVWGALKTKL